MTRQARGQGGERAGHVGSTRERATPRWACPPPSSCRATAAAVLRQASVNRRILISMTDSTPSPSGLASGGRRPAPAALPDAAADARRARWLAIAAIVVACVAVGIAAWRLIAPAGASCQSTAWGATPAVADLPAGWSVGATQFEPDRLSVTLVGPTPQDTSTNRPVVYSTVTCFPQDAAGAVTKSQAATASAGLTVTARTDLGDQGYTAVDQSGASFIQFRTGDVVTYVAASGDATASEAEQVASAFDRALGGNGGSGGTGGAAGSAGPATAAPGAGGPAVPALAPSASAAADVSPDASASSAPAAPELEAKLPTTVGQTTLSIESAVGSAVLGGDAGSRAITAALRAEGKSLDDLHVAQAYDPSGAVDLSIFAFDVAGMKGAALQKIVLDTWLAATGSGVTSSETTIGGRKVLKVDYGDKGSMSYVITDGDIVLVVETANADLAGQAIAALP
jgi:hypothetical protein